MITRSFVGVRGCPVARRPASVPVSGIGRARPACAVLLGLIGWLGVQVQWNAGRLIWSITEAHADNISYAHDASGRLIQASDATSGQAVMYGYDAAGNITSQRVVPLGTLAVSGTSADQGVAGTQITIYGTGFSSTAGSDTVKIGGATATVVSATQTEIVVDVPAGATGSVSVTVGSSTVTTPSSFTTSGSSAAPTLTGFSPGTGAAGTAVTVSGTGFQTNSQSDTVLLNETWASISSATATSLTLAVPAQTGSGKISVATPFGRAVSAADFIVPPTGYSAATIGWTGETTVGSSATISLPAAGKVGLLLFDSTKGALLAIGVSADTIASCTIQVFAPNGSLVTTSAAITATGQGVQIPPLPEDGTYTVVVDPGSNSGSITVKIVAPVPGAIVAGGSSLALVLSPPGERAAVTFNGTQGQYLTLGFTNDTVPSARVTVYVPDGTQLVVGTITASTSGLQLPKLPVTGTYTIIVDPGSSSGNLDVALVTPVTGSITAGGSSLSLNLSPIGQRALVTFSGTAGQYLTLSPQPGIFPAVTVVVSGPAGAQLISQSVSAGTSALQLPGLPATGTYTILVDPGNTSTGLSLSLLNPIAGTQQTNPAVLNLSNPVQRGVITFTGTPGQYVTLTIQEGYEYQPNYISGISVVVYAPDGSNLNTSSTMGPPPGGPTYSFVCENGPCFGSSIINLGPLPTYSSGTTYTAVIQQTGGSGGYLYYSIASPIQSSQSLTVNGSAIEAYFALPGGGMMIPVSLAAGQSYTLTISEVNGNIPQVDAVLLNAQGQAVQGAGMTATCASSCNVGQDDQYSGTESDGIGVGSTGNYTLLIQQVTQTSGANAYPPLAGDLSVQITSP